MTAEIIHDAINPNAIYTPPELARILKCSADLIRKAIREQRLKGRRNGPRNMVVFGRDAEEWIASWPIIGSENSEGNGASPGRRKADAGDIGLASALSDQRSTPRSH